MLNKLFANNNSKRTGFLLEWSELGARPQIDRGSVQEVTKKYETYLAEIKRNYEQLKLEVEPLLQRGELLQVERMQLLEELALQKESQQQVLKSFQMVDQENKELKAIKHKQESAIQQMQKMQMPTQGKSLAEELTINIQNYFQEFLEVYNQQLDEGQEDLDYLFQNLMSDVEDAVQVYANQGSQSSRQSEETTYLKSQLSAALKDCAKLQEECETLRKTNLEMSQRVEKALSVKNSAASENLQQQTEIEKLKQESLKLRQFIADMQKQAGTSEEEKEHLKSELVNSIKDIQEQLRFYQGENEQLKQQVSRKEGQSEKNSEQIHELENKLLQESIKVEQKSKESVKFEKDLQLARQELQKVCDTNTELVKRMELLKEKRIRDKEVLEEQKNTSKKLKHHLSAIELQLETTVQQYDEKIKNLQEILDKTPKYIEPVADVEKDLMLSKQEQQIIELTQKISDYKSTIAKHMVECNDLKEQVKQLQVQNKQLMEKREFALSEIKRLTDKNTVMENELKNRQQPAKQIYKPMASHTKLQDPNSSYVSVQSEAKSVRTVGGAPKFQIPFWGNSVQQSPVLIDKKLSDPDKRLAERQLFQQSEDLRGNLEQLYKTFLTTLMLRDQPSDDLMKFERQINECVKKTQDLNDNIEDLMTL